jgi:hypothetical protein
MDARDGLSPLGRLEMNGHQLPAGLDGKDVSFRTLAAYARCQVKLGLLMSNG